MMKGSVQGDIVREILALPFVSESPLRLTNQVEWHEFTPLAFLLVQSLRPQRILEVGTTVGDSYLSFCQAVQMCKLPTECWCIPRSETTCSRERVSRQLQEFRAYHDALYAKFSKIETKGMSLPSTHGDRHKFNLIHIISSESAGDLGDVCSTWLPRLTVSGVALISGRGPLERSGHKSSLDKARSRYYSRILQTDHWVAALSLQPIGIVRDLLLSSNDEFVLTMKLLRLLGHRVVLQHSAESLRSEVRDLASRLAAAEESEMDAHIRSGEINLRLDQVWVEKEELRKQLQNSEEGSNPSTQEEVSTQVSSDACLFADARKILSGLRQVYSGESQSSARPGRDFWDDCGCSTIASILAKQRRLVFPMSARPRVSVIVVLRNKAHLSVLCLCALLLETGVDYELIIVDNASSDETANVLELVDSAIVIRNSENLGFGPAVMQGAARASGEFLCLLNNDAVLQRGSLAALLGVFAERPDVGAVGGKIRLADGRLQEAGCIVWRDGRVRQLGREDDPSLPQYCFRRPVDYCSGVFFATPRLLFQELGGLDARYSPAYYEDVDYCMKLWNAKRPVIYEPRSVVHHYEGASSSSAVGTREMILINHRRFTDRWRRALCAHQVDHAENIVRARIAAQYVSRKYLYVIEKPPDRSGALYLGSWFQHIYSLLKEGNVITCLHEGENNCAEAGSFLPVDVELRGLRSMTADEINQYCEASDVIVDALPQVKDPDVCKIIGDHSAKAVREESLP